MLRYSKFISSFVLVRRMATMENITFTSSDISDMVPPLNYDQHKGQSGRIGIIGGSREYTGAPYFAAMTTLRLGADLAHVFCSEAAGTALKGYSADLIVHPILDDSDALEQLKLWLPRLHAVVLGPGLGRDEKIMLLAIDILNYLKSIEKLTVIDADGLHVLISRPDILYDYKNLTITPNAVEYKRLLQSISNGKVDVDNNDGIDYLSKEFKDLTVVKKGPIDQIFDSNYLCEVKGVGSPRRCGGQGDILSGAIGLFSYWAHLTNSNHKLLLAAFVGCSFTRRLNSKVFQERGRSMVTGDFIEKIGEVFNDYI